MRLSPLERILLIATVLALAYRYATEQWPIAVEVEDDNA